MVVYALWYFAFLAAVAAGVIGVGVVGLSASAKIAIRFAPVFTAIYFTVGQITKLVDTVIANKDNCRYIALRCISMKGILEDFQPHFDPSRERVETLALLVEEFEKTLALVQKYCDAGWLRKIVSASSLKVRSGSPRAG